MRNKKIANILLIGLLLLFIIVEIIKVNFYDSYYMEMLGFVIEAALVGGIADWFAITALFKKPLGFPWHTAIIPRNREKVIEAVANTVENELLSPKILRSKIEEINIIEGLIQFIDNNPKSQRYIFVLIEKYGTKILKNLKVEQISAFVENSLKENLKKIDISQYCGKLLNFAIKNEECEKLFEKVIDELIVKAKGENTKLEINKLLNGVIEDNLSKVKGLKRMLMEVALDIAKGTNSINILEVSTSMQQQIVEILIRLKVEEDPLHIEIVEKLENMALKLQTDKELMENVEKWKSETIEKISIEKEINEVIKNVLEALKYSIKVENLQEDVSITECKSEKNLQVYTNNILPAIQWLKHKLYDNWMDFKADSNTKKVLENYVKDVIYKIIKVEHGFIGVVVNKVLNGMTDDSLNEFIELKAGNSLHWIRINGCMIGAIFGLIVFLFMNEVYMPIITRLFHL